MFRKVLSLALVLLMIVTMVVACAPPTPELIEKVAACLRSLLAGRLALPLKLTGVAALTISAARLAIPIRWPFPIALPFSRKKTMKPTRSKAMGQSSQKCFVEELVPRLTKWYLEYRKGGSAYELGSSEAGTYGTRMEVFGAYVRYARCRAGISYDKLAERLGVQPRYLNFLEKGLVSAGEISTEFLHQLGLMIGEDPAILFQLCRPEEVKETGQSKGGGYHG